MRATKVDVNRPVRTKSNMSHAQRPGQESALSVAPCVSTRIRRPLWAPKMSRQLPSSSLCEKKVSGFPSAREKDPPGHDDIPAENTLAVTPTEPEATFTRPPKTYHPFSPVVIALLMPASVFGALARLGLEALATYDGKSIFPLAYPQAIGCLIMGLALPLKDTISS